MGVSGCGKSHIGAAFADAIGGTFIDGDSLHPPENIARMGRGEPLDDDARRPWLAQVAAVLGGHEPPVVVGCSALKRMYRDWIRDGAGGAVTFLHLSGERAVIAGRMAAREGHFMPPSLLDSQLATLEPPGDDERAITADIDQPPEAIVAAFVAATREDRP